MNFKSSEKNNLTFSIKLLIIFLFINITALSQVERDSSELSASNYLIKLLNNNVDKQLNTYSFNTQLKYFLRGSKYFIGLNENFNSTIISTVLKNIKDEQLLRLLTQYNFTENFSAGFFIKNNLYSDNRQVSINKTSLLNTSLFLKYKPIEKFEAAPFFGISSNNQIGEEDKGFIYGSEFLLNNFLVGDFNINSFLKYQSEDISPRKNLLRYLSIDLDNKFDEGFNNTISLYLSNQRKDFYFTADEITAAEFNIINNIQSREETNYLMQDRIKINPQNSNLNIDIQGRIYLRNIERNTRYISLKNISSSSFDSKIKELRLDLISSAEYKIDNLNLSLKFAMSEREEKHQPRKIEGISEIIFNEREKSESLKNNISQTVNLALNSNFEITSSDRLTFSLFHRKLKYDTPSQDNYDDRDELLSMGRILYEKKFSSYFRAFMNLEGSLNKIVYIFSERSSNNNVQRIIRFSSGGIIKFRNFVTSNSAEVSANYTVFDYEKLNPNYKSYSFRQFIYRDSSSIMIKKNLFFMINGYIKLSEQGDFQWSNFTSKPLRYLSEQYIEPKIVFNYFSLNVGPGLRYFSLSTYNFKKGMEKNKLSDYLSIGPVLEINYDVSGDINFRLYGWYEFIRTENQNKRENANFNMRLSYNF